MINQKRQLNQPSDFESLKDILEKIGFKLSHKHNPGWASQDRLIFSAANTRLCFSFDESGEVISLSWGPWQDMV
jgi:hypothetical protein